MEDNIGNNEAEKFSDYRKTLDGDDEQGNKENDADDLPGDLKPDEDDEDSDDQDTEILDEIEEEEFQEEINHNFPLSGGGTPLDV